MEPIQLSIYLFDSAALNVLMGVVAVLMIVKVVIRIVEALPG